MIRPLGDIETLAGAYAGLRMTAEEYLALAGDGNRYELIDGVVQMSPGAAPDHQLVALEITRQLSNYVRDNSLGIVLYETDVYLGTSKSGQDLVYRPEIIFVGARHANQVTRRRVRTIPDVVVEVVSPDSRGLDTVTKFNDYERAGVQEYWLIDLPKEKMSFFVLTQGKFAEAPAAGHQFHSRAVAGFVLDLDLVRQSFHMLGD